MYAARMNLTAYMNISSEEFNHNSLTWYMQSFDIPTSLCSSLFEFYNKAIWQESFLAFAEMINSNKKIFKIFSADKMYFYIHDV